MKRSKFSLMPREEFANLSLHEKNAYLQDLSKQFAALHEREQCELDREALSRLRRYYSRRVWADLKLDQLEDNAINRAIRNLGEAIRNESLQADVAAVLMQESKPKRVLRSAPPEDAQLTFFVPTVYDAPIKDDVNLMDVAPFSLSKRANAGIIRYELKDSLITIEGVQRPAWQQFSTTTSSSTWSLTLPTKCSVIAGKRPRGCGQACRQKPIGRVPRTS